MKPPYYTTFRRKVRTWVLPVSAEVPFAMAQNVIREDLNGRKHAIIESSWRDAPGYYSLDEFRGGENHRTIQVRYVTGGMRHGLGPSVDWERVPAWVEFTRMHGSFSVAP